MTQTEVPMAGPETSVAPTSAATDKPRRWRNGFAVVPMRVFLGCLFAFAGYAKLTYPGFLDASNQTGFKAILVGVKPNSPIGGLLQPMIDHSSLFGHLTAFAEIAIGAGLVVGLLTRLAALGGIALTTLIALSVNWTSIKQYTGSYGWYTSVDIAVAVALTTFVLGGAGPLSGDWLFGWMRARRRRIAPSDGYHQPSVDESMARLRPDPDWNAPGIIGFDEPVYRSEPPTEIHRASAPTPPAPAQAPAPPAPVPAGPPPAHGSGSRPADAASREPDDEESERIMTPPSSRSASEPPTRTWSAGDTAEFARIDEPDLIEEPDELPPPPGV